MTEQQLGSALREYMNSTSVEHTLKWLARQMSLIAEGAETGFDIEDPTNGVIISVTVPNEAD